MRVTCAFAPSCLPSNLANRAIGGAQSAEARYGVGLGGPEVRRGATRLRLWLGALSLSRVSTGGEKRKVGRWFPDRKRPAARGTWRPPCPRLQEPRIESWTQGESKMAVIVGERSGVSEGQPAFDLLSNRCDFFEIGQREGEDVWLQGELAGPDKEFVFNGRLFSADGGHATVIDGFPKSDVADGWTKQQDLDTGGYSLKDQNGETVFGFSVVDTVCYVTVGLHRKDGGFAAIPGQGGLVTDGAITVKIGQGGGAIRIN
jgi:hypothetical protein